jgi:membrane protein implicated in regulation of membrane protease activity
VDNLLLEPDYWNWWLLGLVLIVAEILVPGTFLLWMGIAALCVGGLVFLFPGLDWQWQWLLFAVLTVFSILVWLWYFKSRPERSASPNLNRRGQHYVGRVFVLDSPIVNSRGRIRVDDSTWKVEAPDCPAGTRIKIVDVDGVVLKGKIEK